VLASELVLAWGEGVDLVVDEQATKRLRLATVARESVIFFSDIMSPFFQELKAEKLQNYSTYTISNKGNKVNQATMFL